MRLHVREEHDTVVVPERCPDRVAEERAVTHRTDPRLHRLDGPQDRLSHPEPDRLAGRGGRHQLNLRRSPRYRSGEQGGDLEVSYLRPRDTGDVIDAEVSVSTSVRPGSAGMFATECSSAVCSVGTHRSDGTFLYADQNRYGNCRDRATSSGSASTSWT